MNKPKLDPNQISKAQLAKSLQASECGQAVEQLYSVQLTGENLEITKTDLNSYKMTNVVCQMAEFCRSINQQEYNIEVLKQV